MIERIVVEDSVAVVGPISKVLVVLVLPVSGGTHHKLLVLTLRQLILDALIPDDVHP